MLKIGGLRLALARHFVTFILHASNNVTDSAALKNSHIIEAPCLDDIIDFFINSSSSIYLLVVATHVL